MWLVATVPDRAGYGAFPARQEVLLDSAVHPALLFRVQEALTPTPRA